MGKYNPQRTLEQAQASYRTNTFSSFYSIPDTDPTLLEMADLTSSDTGVLNKVFGRAVWAQLNTQSNAYGSLPKVQASGGRPYGWRAKTAFADTGSGGQAEGTVPTAVESTYAEVAPSIKEHSTQMRVSGMQQDLADGPDDAYGAIAEISGELGYEHLKQHERAILTDIDTLAGNNIESLDRITASSDNQATIGWTAADEDIYGIDRSANTWANANQTVASTAETLTLKAIDTLIRQSFSNGGQPSHIVTGWDTWESISDLVEPRGRWEMGIENLQTGSVNDADTPEGTAVATFINRYQGLPIVASDQAVADSSEISRLYVLDVSNPEGMDKPRLGVDVLKPTQVYFAGERSGTTPQSIGFVGDSVLAVTRSEVVCRYFKAQGQLRDRTSP